MGVPTGLRATTSADLDRVLLTEALDDVQPYIGRWDRQRHQAAIDSDAEAHLTIVDGDGSSVGYVLLGTLHDPNRSLELRRIVTFQRGSAHGRMALAQVLEFAFEQLDRHRVWLDVAVGNERARRAYLAVGFVEEGVLRDAFLCDGEYRSLLVMSVLAPDWRSGR